MFDIDFPSFFEKNDPFLFVMFILVTPNRLLSFIFREVNFVSLNVTHSEPGTFHATFGFYHDIGMAAHSKHFHIAENFKVFSNNTSIVHLILSRTAFVFAK